MSDIYKKHLHQGIDEHRNCYDYEFNPVSYWMQNAKFDHADITIQIANQVSNSSYKNVR